MSLGPGGPSCCASALPCILPSLHPTSIQSHLEMLYGDLYGLMAASAIAMLLNTGKYIQTCVPPILLINLMMATASCVTTILCWLLLGATATADTWHGLAGFMSPMWTVSVWAGGLCMFAGWAGTILVSRYVNPVVVSSFLTLEPCVAIVLGMLMHVEPCPSFSTIVGCLVIVAATALVSVCSRDEGDGQLVPLVLDDMHGKLTPEKQVLEAASEAVRSPQVQAPVGPQGADPSSVGPQGADPSSVGPQGADPSSVGPQGADPSSVV